MDTIGIILLSILTLITLIASFLLLNGLFSGRVNAVQAALEANWKRSFWLGLVNSLFLFAVLLGLFALGDQTPIFMIPALALSAAVLLFWVFGLTALARLLGLQLFPERKPVPQLIRGGWVLLGTSLLPGLGWFVFFPYLVFLGFGAVLLALFQKSSSPVIDEDSSLPEN